MGRVEHYTEHIKPSSHTVQFYLFFSFLPFFYSLFLVFSIRLLLFLFHLFSFRLFVSFLFLSFLYRLLLSFFFFPLCASFFLSFIHPRLPQMRSNFFFLHSNVYLQSCEILRMCKHAHSRQNTFINE